MTQTQGIPGSCCISGGGPAGLMLGFLMARKGVRVTVLEKHADFLRDFRGDTIHPSTLDVIAELGLLDEFLALPHQKVQQLVGGVYGDAGAVRGFQPRAHALQVPGDDAAVGFPGFPRRPGAQAARTSPSIWSMKS